MAVAPGVATFACSGTTGEKSTGNAYITTLGDSAVTQHGHCWATTANPTTADSKTTNGAAPQTGSFTSSITGLTVGTLYYVRAYATNSTDTSYGSDVTITTGTTVGRRHAWIEDEDLHYFGESGTELKAQGTAVASDVDIQSWIWG